MQDLARARAHHGEKPRLRRAPGRLARLAHRLTASAGALYPVRRAGKRRCAQSRFRRSGRDVAFRLRYESPGIPVGNGASLEPSEAPLRTAALLRAVAASRALWQQQGAGTRTDTRAPP